MYILIGMVYNNRIVKKPKSKDTWNREIEWRRNIFMVNNYGEFKRDQNVKQTPKKSKRVSVSSKRQITIPKEYFDALEIDDEVYIELVGNKLVVKPVIYGAEDFSEEILRDVVREGFEGYELIQEFKHRKSQVKPALDSLIEDTDKQEFTTLEKLFEDDKK